MTAPVLNNHREDGRLRERLGGIEIEQFRGDNFAVWLCSQFEDADDEGEEDDCGWKPSSIAGYEAVTAAIHAHYQPTLEALTAKIAGLEGALRTIHDKFQRDNKQGYHTKDKTFAIEIARAALSPKDGMAK